MPTLACIFPLLTTSTKHGIIHPEVKVKITLEKSDITNIFVL
jgi:hypothetical protein